MTEDALCCHFCGKYKSQVKHLIAAGTPAYACICDECVTLCQEIITEDNDAWFASRQRQHPRCLPHVRR